MKPIRKSAKESDAAQTPKREQPRFHKVLVVYQEHWEAAHALKDVRSTLEDMRIKYDEKVREKLRERDTKNASLILVIGGDGTFLRASHFVRDGAMMLGINADPVLKEGFFMAATPLTLRAWLEKIKRGNFEHVKLQRLEARINNKLLPELAVNEIFFGRPKSYCTSRYTLVAGDRKEEQKSSGVLISAPAGTYAWTCSAGGKKLPLDSDSFQVMVREVYRGRLTKDSLRQKILARREVVNIISQMNTNVAVIDSISPEYTLGKGDVLSVCLSDCPLTVIGLKKNPKR